MAQPSLAKHLVVVLVVLFVVPASAFAATIKVRIEGKTQTLFSPTEIAVTAATAQDALEQASILGELYYHVTTSSFGRYVDQIGRYGGTASSGWVFKVNDISPPVGADQVTLKDGDRVLWYYADFGPTGGPPTLELKATKNGCYAVQAWDDNGKPASANGVLLHVGSKRTVAAKLFTPVCPGPHPGLLVRATATGAVRSNAVK